MTAEVIKAGRVFNKYTGRYVNLVVGTRYSQPEYTPLDVSRILRMWADYVKRVEDVVPKTEDTEKADDISKSEETTPKASTSKASTSKASTK